MSETDHDVKTLNASLTIPWGSLQRVIDWCNANCAHPWKYTIIIDAGQESGNYQFNFESDEDYVKFMVWLK